MLPLIRYNNEIFPREILANIFGFLSFKQQALASLVCRFWRRAALSQIVDFGKVFALKRIISITPENSILWTSDKRGVIIHSFCQKYVLFSNSFDLAHPLFLLCKKTKKILEIHLKRDSSFKSLDIDCLRSAFFIDAQNFALATKNGKISLWKIGEDKVACCNALELFEKKEKSITPSVIAASLSGRGLVVNYLDVEDSFSAKEFFQTLELPTLKKESLQSRIHLIERAYTFADSFYYIKKKNSQYLCCYDMRFNLELQLHKISSTQDRKCISCRIVEVNAEWVILEKIYSAKKKIGSLFFSVYSFQDKKEYDLFEGAISFSSLNQRWLRKDFFLVWNGEELRIWHLQSTCFLSAISLKRFFQKDPQDPHTMHYRPILDIEIEEQELCIYWRDIDEKDLHSLRFTLRDC